MSLSVRRLLTEVCFRILLLIAFLYSETLKPFIRIIQNEEWWLYKYPLSTSPTIPTFQLYTIVTFAPIFTIIIFSGVLKRSKKHDVVIGLLCSSLAFLLNAFLTNLMKITVGRPRPDFFHRCFPGGVVPFSQPSVLSLQCTGDTNIIMEGRKSFPSGHSSCSFVSLTFCALYLCGKLHCFNTNGRGFIVRIFAILLPLCLATWIAISRTCDYRHHWQDVVVGSVFGFSIAYFIYFQYYPSLSHPSCHIPLVDQRDQIQLEGVTSGKSEPVNTRNYAFN